VAEKSGGGKLKVKKSGAITIALTNLTSEKEVIITPYAGKQEGEPKILKVVAAK
jgi:hypothetical protein